MFRGGRTLMSAGVGVLLLALTCGCSKGSSAEDGEAFSSPSVAVTPSTAPPTPLPRPTLPTSATATQKGAEVFVRYFWDVFNYTYATGDTQLLKSISGKTCGFCKDVSGDVAKIHAAGGRIEGSQVLMNEAIASPGDLRVGLLVVSMISQSAGSTIDGKGNVLSHEPGILNRRVRLVVSRDGRWVVDAVEVEKEERP